MAAQFPGQPFPHRVVIDNTIGCATGCGGPVGWGCYSLHILKRGVPAGCFPGFCTQDCYSAHIFSLPMRPYLSQYRRFFVFYQQLLFFAHFYGLPPLSPRIHHSRQRKCWVVIHSTILCTAFFIRFPNCVSANSPGKYNLAGKILSASPSKKFSSSPLLSSAHFQNLKNPFQFSPPTIAQQKYFFSAIYAVNNNRGPLLLSAAQFQIACLPYAKSFAAPSDCYSAHILPHSPHFVPK